MEILCGLKWIQALTPKRYVCVNVPCALWNDVVYNLHINSKSTMLILKTINNLFINMG